MGKKQEKMIIACDIDGVLAIIKGYVEKYLPHNWKEYFAHTLEFPPVWQMCFIVDALASNYANVQVIYTTGRPESNRDLTEVWLKEMAGVPLDSGNCRLLMRSDNDHRPTHEIKLEWFRELKPDLIIDDDPKVIVAATEVGFTVLQVHGHRSTPHDMIPTDYLGGKH